MKFGDSISFIDKWVFAYDLWFILYKIVYCATGQTVYVNHIFNHQFSMLNSLAMYQLDYEYISNVKLHRIWYVIMLYEIGVDVLFILRAQSYFLPF